jgi:hypothetical protein
LIFHVDSRAANAKGEFFPVRGKTREERASKSPDVSKKAIVKLGGLDTRLSTLEPPVSHLVNTCSLGSISVMENDLRPFPNNKIREFSHRADKISIAKFKLVTTTDDDVDK